MALFLDFHSVTSNRGDQFLVVYNFSFKNWEEHSPHSFIGAKGDCSLLSIHFFKNVSSDQPNSFDPQIGIGQRQTDQKFSFSQKQQNFLGSPNSAKNAVVFVILSIVQLKFFSSARLDFFQNFLFFAHKVSEKDFLFVRSNISTSLGLIK